MRGQHHVRFPAHFFLWLSVYASIGVLLLHAGTSDAANITSAVLNSRVSAGSNTTATSAKVKVIRVCPRHGNFNTGTDTTECDPDTRIKQGYEHDFFNKTWEGMPASIRNKYRREWVPCGTYTQVLSDTAKGHCDVTFGSITIAAVTDRANLAFVGISYTGNLMLAVAKGKDVHRLAVTAPFSNQSKAIIGVIPCLFFGAWIMDFLGRWILNRFTATTSSEPFLLLALRQGRGLRFFGSSLMVLIAIIIIQLLFSVFCSYLTSTLIVDDNLGGISSVAELQQSKKDIWTTRTYESRAQALGFKKLVVEDPTPDLASKWWYPLVESRSLGAVLLDDTVLLNFQQSYSDIYLLKEFLAPYSLGFAWNLNVSQELLREFDLSSRKLWDSGYVDTNAPGLLHKSTSTFSYGKDTPANDGTGGKFDLLDITGFKVAFISAIAGAGLVFIVELYLQVALENRAAGHPQQPPADANASIQAPAQPSNSATMNGAGALPVQERCGSDGADAA